MGHFGRLKVNDFHKAADQTTSPGDRCDFGLAKEGLATGYRLPEMLNASPLMGL
jgi:hypothetical protein